MRTYATAPSGHARYDELQYARAGRAPLRHRPSRGPRRRAGDARVRARARLPPGRAAVGLDGDAPALRHPAGARARARSSCRSARAPTSSSTATRATSTIAASSFPSSAGCPGPSAGRWAPLAVHATSRAGRAVRHGEALYDAGHSRIPYWGGALCFRGPLKERLLRRGDHGALRDGRAHLGRGRRPAQRRRPLPAHDLPRAAPTAARAAARAHGPHRDGELGRGPRAVPRSRARRVRDGAAAADEVPRRTGQARPARGDARRAAARDPRAPQAGLRQPDGGVAARPLRPRRARGGPRLARWPSASCSTTTSSTACSPPIAAAAATGASTCGTSTASAGGTTGGWHDRRRRGPPLLLDGLPTGHPRRACGLGLAGVLRGRGGAALRAGARHPRARGLRALGRARRPGGRLRHRDRRRALRARRRALHRHRLQPDGPRAGRSDGPSWPANASSTGRSSSSRSRMPASTSSIPTASSTTFRRPAGRSPSSIASCVPAARRSSWSTTAAR